MQNPFNKTTETDKFKFFNEMTEAINEWMLAKYPLFDQRLESKIKDLEYATNNAKTNLNTFQLTLEETKKTQLQFFKDQINAFLDEEHPGVASKLYRLSEDLIKLQKKLIKNDEGLQDKLNTISKSQTLYQDVYQMRDEMKVLKKEWENFSDKLRKIFK